MSRSKQTFEVNSWTDVGVDAIQTPELNSDQRAKFVVIGAGYSGVAAARRLATLHPDSEIVLLESEWFGDGSSSRSSGFVVSLGQFERPGSPENQRFPDHECIRERGASLSKRISDRRPRGSL